ncbi:unnamed protein product, partial [Iphiclides podalirius]
MRECDEVLTQMGVEAAFAQLWSIEATRSRLQNAAFDSANGDLKRSLCAGLRHLYDPDDPKVWLQAGLPCGVLCLARGRGRLCPPAARACVSRAACAVGTARHRAPSPQNFLTSAPFRVEVGRERGKLARMSIQKCLLDNSSRMIKAMSTAKSNNSDVKTVSD